MIKILARHKWVLGATITESLVDEDKNIRRFTATIRGWRNFKIYEGADINTKSIIKKVKEIRGRIDMGDETVFAKGCNYESSL
ncbi:MAG: hypothetical protein ACYDIA_01810 [Candidatus Humimicrobiaceae bacterium]